MDEKKLNPDFYPAQERQERLDRALTKINAGIKELNHVFDDIGENDGGSELYYQAQTEVLSHVLEFIQESMEFNINFKKNFKNDNVGGK